MKKIVNPKEVINSSIITPGTRIYCAGNAATPQVLLKYLCEDTSIKDIEMISVLLLGEINELFSEETCSRITQRVIFNGPLSRHAVNSGWANYQLLHLSDIPRQVREYLKPDMVFVSVSGPDNGGNFSLGTSVKGVLAAVQIAKKTTE